MINYIILSWILTLEKKFDFAVGGQAVIEGVMMRSPNNVITAVRKPDKTIKVHKRSYKALTQRYKFLNIPILRGVINLFEMMVIGTTSINFSATESLEEEEKPQKKPNKYLDGIFFSISLIIALAFSLFLFKFLPLWITTFIETKAPYIQSNYMVFNLIDGVIKMTFFLTYIFLLTLIPSFRRIFEYHGAEHKAIHTYESGKELTPKNAAKHTRFHPRCGTSFILIVFAISILVYTVVPKQDTFTVNLALRLAFLPIIAGISYEYLKLSAKYSANTFVKALVAPGLWFQRLTTKEPDHDQLEVSLKSLKDALDLEKA